VRREAFFGISSGQREMAPELLRASSGLPSDGWAPGGPDAEREGVRRPTAEEATRAIRPHPHRRSRLAGRRGARTVAFPAISHQGQPRARATCDGRTRAGPLRRGRTTGSRNACHGSDDLRDESRCTAHGPAATPAGLRPGRGLPGSPIHCSPWPKAVCSVPEGLPPEQPPGDD
jgi:hypothetical protein